MTTMLLNLLTEKIDKKIHDFEVLVFFENLLLLSITESSLQTSCWDDIILGNFTLPNSISLVENLIRWKRGFEIFLIDR